MLEVLALFLGRGQAVRGRSPWLTVLISVGSYGAQGPLCLANTSFSSPSAVWHICLELLSAAFVTVTVHCHSNQIRDRMSAWALGHSGMSLGLSIYETSAGPSVPVERDTGLPCLYLTKPP